MPVLVSAIREIQHLYDQDAGLKKPSLKDRKELDELLAFCEQIEQDASPNYILNIEAIYQLFNLTLNIYFKKQNGTKKIIDYIIGNCFSKPFFEVEVKLREKKINSFDIFKTFWEQPAVFDSTFLKLIELLQGNHLLAKVDILELSKFAQNAQHVYSGLMFLKNYKLDTLENVKTLCKQARFAETLSNAWYYLVENDFPFHHEISIPKNVIKIINVMLQNPQESLRLAKGIVILYWNSLFFDYFELLCNHPRHALELANAFVILIKHPKYYAGMVEIIAQNPEYADELAGALNILMTHRLHEYYMMLISNPRKARIIAQLIVLLYNKDAINIDIRSGIVNNAKYIDYLYNIVVMLQRLSSMLKAQILYPIFNNADLIPDIHDKLMKMPVGEFNLLDPAGLSKLIDEIKNDKIKQEQEKKKEREKKLGLEPRAEVSPQENIQGFYGARHYLDENIFLLKTSIAKHASINHIKKAYVQLLQHGINSKEEKILHAMCDLFDYINRNEHKIKINSHKNPRYDTLFSKNNTKAWTDMMKVIRDQAYQLLMVLVDQEPNTNKKIALLEEMSAKAIFAEHRTNSFFNRFHETATFKAIVKKIEMLRASVPLSLN